MKLRNYVFHASFFEILFEIFLTDGFIHPSESCGQDTSLPKGEKAIFCTRAFRGNQLSVFPSYADLVFLIPRKLVSGFGEFEVPQDRYDDSGSDYEISYELYIKRPVHISECQIIADDWSKKCFLEKSYLEFRSNWEGLYQTGRGLKIDPKHFYDFYEKDGATDPDARFSVDDFYLEERWKEFRLLVSAMETFKVGEAREALHCDSSYFEFSSPPLMEAQKGFPQNFYR